MKEITRCRSLRLVCRTLSWTRRGIGKCDHCCLSCLKSFSSFWALLKVYSSYIIHVVKCICQFIIISSRSASRPIRPSLFQALSQWGRSKKRARDERPHWPRAWNRLHKAVIINTQSIMAVIVQPVFTSRKIAHEFPTNEPKPQLIDQQCVVYNFKCEQCDAGYVGYTWTSVRTRRRT